MKRIYLLIIFFLTILISLASIRFVTSVGMVESTFSPIVANPTNLIDIQKMTPPDFKDTSQGKFGGVFVSKNGSEKQVYFYDKPLQEFALSPSHQQAIFTYEPNDQGLSIILYNLKSSETREIFYTIDSSWGVTNDPKWLGDSHIIFLRHCGTSCQGLTLLNVQSRDFTNATLSYMSYSDQPSYTHFEDWFGEEHKMENFVGKMHAEEVDGKSYLIFEMTNEAGELRGQQKFLFSRESLVLEDL